MLLEKRYSELSEEEKKRLLDLYEKMFEEIFQAPYTEKERILLKEMLAKDKERKFLLWYDEKEGIQGFMQFRKPEESKSLFIDFMYVAEPERKKGIARMMVNRAYNIARRENAEMMITLPVTQASEKIFKNLYGKVSEGGGWRARVSKGPKIPAHGFISKEALEILKKKRKK